MRVIVSCVPQTGHILPLLPLAQAFKAQGDDVVVASGPDAAEAVSGQGLPFRAAGPEFGAWFGALRARTRGLPGDGLEPSRVQSYFVPRLFGEIGMALMLDDLLGLCKELEPSLLVFERIREELELGKTVRNAVALGFSRAFATIIDTHVTTIVSALFLFQFGTGPIKGFAVTLTVGLAISMFTAVFVSRTIFETELSRRAQTKTLSI